MTTAIPTNHLVPLFWASMDASGANTASANYPTLLVGQTLSGGTGAVDTLYQVTSAAEVSELFGAGSMLHRQALAYFANDSFAEVYVYGVADPDPGVAATGKITILGPATADGILHLEIGGQPLSISVNAGDTANDVGAAIALALPTHASEPNDYPVSAGNTSGVVVFTCKWKGETGNNIKLALNPLGPRGRQVTPAGLTVTITNPMGDLGTTGTGAPDLSDLGGIIASFDMDHCILGCSDIDDTLLALGTEFNDSTGRWSYSRQQYGHVWACQQGTSSELATFLQAQNDQHVTYIGIEGSQADFSPKLGNPTYEVAAAYAGRCAASLRIDPAQPCQTLELLNSLDGKVKFRAPAMQDKFSVSVRNSLLGDGCATVTYSRAGKILIEREVTTYTENSFGSPDNSYQDVQVLSCSQKWLRDLKTKIESDFGRSKLNDLTKRAVKACVVAKYAELEDLGITEDTDGFAASLSVEVNGEDPNRLDILASPNYVNQLRVVALLNKFTR